MAKQNVAGQETLGEAMNKTEFFFEKNGRKMTYVFLVLLVIAALIYGYRVLIVHPRAEKAAEMIAEAQNRFDAENPDFELALVGDANGAGFLDVIEQYGCDNYLDYRIKVWGCKNEIGDCETEDEDDTLSYDFSTAWDAPMAFMLKLAAACPEGQWQWRCEAECGTDWLVFELNQGEVIITEHGIDEEYVESVDDIYWNDRGEVPGVNDIENDTALIPGEVFSVNPNYKVVLDD